MEKVLVLLYDGFVGYELMMTTALLKHKYEIVTVAPEKETFQETGGLLLTAHQQLEDFELTDDYRAVVIPGGQWDDLLANIQATKLLQDAYEKGLVMGAICAAPIHLAKAGILKGRKFTTSLRENVGEHFEWENREDEAVVVSGPVVTAKGNAYLEFAFALADQLELFDNQEERDMTFKYFKNEL